MIGKQCVIKIYKMRFEALWKQFGKDYTKQQLDALIEKCYEKDIMHASYEKACRKYKVQPKCYYDGQNDEFKDIKDEHKKIAMENNDNNNDSTNKNESNKHKQETEKEIAKFDFKFANKKSSIAVFTFGKAAVPNNNNNNNSNNINKNESQKTVFSGFSLNGSQSMISQQTHNTTQQTAAVSVPRNNNSNVKNQIKHGKREKDDSDEDMDDNDNDNINNNNNSNNNMHFLNLQQSQSQSANQFSAMMAQSQPRESTHTATQMAFQKNQPSNILQQTGIFLFFFFFFFFWF